MSENQIVKKEWQGVFIPRKIWEETDLTWIEKLFWAEIKGLDNENGCYASNGHFSEVFSLSKNRVSEIINSLIIKKFVTAEYEWSADRIIKRTLRISEEKRDKIFGKKEKARVIIRKSKEGTRNEMDKVRELRI